MREIVLDTETTGLDAKKGDRLIELGCIELMNRVPTGAEFHAFINPETREVHPDAERIHGISTAFLKDKPLFAHVVDGFLEFIGQDTLVIHNANFDIGFIKTYIVRILKVIHLIPKLDLDSLSLIISEYCNTNAFHYDFEMYLHRDFEKLWQRFDNLQKEMITSSVAQFICQDIDASFATSASQLSVFLGSIATNPTLSKYDSFLSSLNVQRDLHVFLL